MIVPIVNSYNYNLQDASITIARPIQNREDSVIISDDEIGERSGYEFILIVFVSTG